MYKNVVEYLLNSANKYPNKVAFQDKDTCLTYEQVKEKSIRIGDNIEEIIGGEVRKPIVVHMEKSVNMLCAFLGIAYSGNFYIPIDVKMPLQRMKKIIETLKPELIISNSQEDKMFDSIKVINYSNLIKEPTSDNYQPGYRRILDIDPLYVLFTSGSTGDPKGVTITNRGVIDYTEWLSEKFSFNEKTIFGNQAPFYFDNSILDIYSTLKNGSKLVIIPELLFTFSYKLCEFINENDINTIFWVPSALISVANSGALANSRLDKLEKVLFCGEVMPNKQLNIWRNSYPNILYANLYGPTEITDVCSYYIVDREFSDDEPLPIGQACENMEIIVLNENDKLVKNGEAGELCVRGCGVSLGYYNNKDKSSKAFVQNPLNNHYQDIIYRTGDIVKYNQQGELIYLNRKDFQIKKNGFRIELGEIETIAMSMDGIDICCALFDEETNKILLFVKSNSELTEKQVYFFLKERIPSYMLPDKIDLLKDIPFNDNGKIDKNRIKKDWIHNKN